MASNYVVYLAYNVVTDMYYVGKTTTGSPSIRWKGHLFDMQRGSTTHIHNAIRKYGSESFTLDVLGSTSSPEELAHLESLWILLLNSYDHSIGYNTSVGEQRGIHLTEEQKRKIGLGNRGKVRSEAWKKYFSNLYKGKKRDPEIGKRHSLMMKGRPCRITEEGKRQIGEKNSKNLSGKKRGFWITNELVDKVCATDIPSGWRKGRHRSSKYNSGQKERFRRESQLLKGKKRVRIRICFGCYNPFNPSWNEQVFCSRQCYSETLRRLKL